jgi:signal transduction histidine kinase
MLHEFLTAHQAELIDRCRSKVALRPAPQAAGADHGIPIFIDQLIRTLRMEQTNEPMQSRQVSGPTGGARSDLSEIGVTATQHGRELLRRGFTVDQVVHDYGDLCQAVTDLAFEKGATIEIDEFRTLNRCLDNAIADAVAEFSNQHDALIESQHAHDLGEKLGFFAHELRDLIHTATLAVTAMKTGKVGLGGATASLLDRSLIRLRALVDRSLSDVRITAGSPARLQRINLSDFIATVKVSATLEARARGCRFSVAAVEPDLALNVDRDLLFSAVGNLLQNAFKFTKRPNVALRAHAAADRILIEVEDQCGGLAPGDTERMFLPFVQTGPDKSGHGLGLSICRRSVEANKGILGVRSLAGSGCIFTIDLPRCPPSVPASTRGGRPSKRRRVDRRITGV